MTWRADARGPDLNKSWVISQYPTDAHGHRLADISCPHNAGGTCHVKAFGDGPAGFMHAVYHPNSHFWALQGIETALFGVAAIALVGFAAWWTLRRAR